MRCLTFVLGGAVSLALTVAAPSPAADDPLRPPAIAVEDVPVVPAELAERLQQYQAVRSAGFRGWAPDGRGILVRTRFGNTAQLHRVYRPGGRREQVTFYAEPAGGEFLKGAAGKLLVEMAAGGNERYQIYLHDLESGRARLLTDGDSRNLLGPVAEDGSFLLLISNRRNGRDMDLFRLGLANLSSVGPGDAEPVMPVDGEYWVPMDLAPDGGRALLKRYVSINESYPAVLDLSTGRRTPIPFPDGASGKIAVGGMQFDPGGESVLLATDARGEFLELARVDLANGEYTWLSEAIDWNVETIVTDQRSGRTAVGVNEYGASALYLLEDDELRLLRLPLGIVGSLEFSPDGKRLGMSLSRPNAPADAYSLELAGGRLVRWTYSEVGGLDPGTFVTPERIEFTTFDERQIPAYVFTPPGASADNPAPVLVKIHGGPESQYRPYFSGNDQFLLNEMGIAVVRPNVRGSAGYGKTYLQLDNAALRENSVRDIGALLEWIGEQPQFDSSRIAVYGGSYGGYMVLSSLVHYSDQLRAGVDIVGIASFRTFLENTSEYRRDLRRAEYGDERTPEMRTLFERIDPLHNAEKIGTALLVAHGRNDPRVPFSEAEQIAPRVRKSGQTVWTLYADNEGHGFRRKENRDYLTAVVALFLERHLLGGGD